MKTEKTQMPQLSDEEAARILQNVFSACEVPENETPFPKLKENYEKHVRTYRVLWGTAFISAVILLTMVLIFLIVMK